MKKKEDGMRPDEAKSPTNSLISISSLAERVHSRSHVCQGEALYLINPQGLYIIKLQKDFIHAYGVMRCKGGKPSLVIYRLRRMIYQACGLDKKTDLQMQVCFLVREKGLEPSRLWWNTGTSSLPVYLFQHSRI